MQDLTFRMGLAVNTLSALKDVIDTVPTVEILHKSWILREGLGLVVKTMDKLSSYRQGINLAAEALQHIRCYRGRVGEYPSIAEITRRWNDLRLMRLIVK